MRCSTRVSHRIPLLVRIVTHYVSRTMMKKSAAPSSSSTHRRQQQNSHLHHSNLLFVVVLLCLLSVAFINIGIGGLGRGATILCSQQQQQQPQLLPQRSIRSASSASSSIVDDNNNNVEDHDYYDGNKGGDIVVALSSLSSSSSPFRKGGKIRSGTTEMDPGLPPSSSDEEQQQQPPPPRSELSLSESTSLLLQSTRKRYAYAFYATGEDYACGALVNIQALRDSGSGVGLRSSSGTSSINNNNSTDDSSSSSSDYNVGSGHPFNDTITTTATTSTTTTTLDFIIVTYGFDTTALERRASTMNVIIKKVNHLKTFQGANHYYHGEQTSHVPWNNITDSQHYYSTHLRGFLTLYTYSHSIISTRCHGKITHLPTL